MCSSIKLKVEWIFIKYMCMFTRKLLVMKFGIKKYNGFLQNTSRRIIFMFNDNLELERNMTIYEMMTSSQYIKEYECVQ